MQRWVRIFAAVFWFFWATVIVPGHTRGVVQLDSKHSPCCHATRHSAPAKSSVPSSKNCAICYIAAKLGSEASIPPAALQLPFAHRANVVQATEAPALELILAFHTRGPPDSSTFNT